MPRLRDRSTGEILIILVGVTVCGYVIINGLLIIVLAFFTDRDLSDAARNIADIINTLIGLLAGYLAGRTDVAMKQDEKAREQRREQN